MRNSTYHTSVESGQLLKDPWAILVCVWLLSILKTILSFLLLESSILGSTVVPRLTMLIRSSEIAVQ